MFLIPASTSENEQLIKNSRFITFIAHATSPSSAHSFIASVREKYPDANHVCWAFIAGQPGQTTLLSCSDDGEPAGTAGKPMLNVLQHGNIGEVVAVVVRYFGGIKLGTGGLVRAYSSSVVQALKQTPTQPKVALYSIDLQVPYPLEDSVRRSLNQYQASIEQADYTEVLCLSIQCPDDQWPALQKQLGDVGRGQIIFKPKKKLL